MMKIVHLTTEFAPVAKIGGIGDVLLGLSRALMEEGHQVEITLPFYQHIDRKLLSNLEVHEKDSFDFGDSQVEYKIWGAYFQKIPIRLVEIMHPSNPFDRGVIYGESDDSLRFSLFTKAACHSLENKTFDLIHTHDWMTGFAPYLFKNKQTNSILSLHNLAYTGMTTSKNLEDLGVPLPDFDLEGEYCLLKGAIEISDLLNTVSPTYAKEILSPPLCGPFREILNLRKSEIVGILNGIDYSFWDPASDSYLERHYSSENLKNKTLLKQELMEKLKLINPEKPLISSISRLVPQKGPELILHAFDYALNQGCSCILLGSSKDAKARAPFETLQSRFPHQVHIEFEYNESLSHQVFAASDLTLVPSHFEPCGLTQMIAMRFGTLPLVRLTGGLKDTVNQENGFCFESPQKEAIEETLKEALEVWEHDQKRWKRMQKKGMSQDFSWRIPAKEYVKAYSGILEKKKLTEKK